ncbi:MAG TPA: hypothetical protein PLJ60_13560 [Chryseolinea sp.]|nr:hypothetical protein [Chryseolinea sp.]HPH47583.1 hypothetical protein [Chryseolinea sp.]HPM31357.1 hypothetical protein [Chryseolinea sp.]
MKRYLFFLILIFSTSFSYAQIAKDILVGGSFDLIKTGNEGFMKKVQMGVEGNYFLTRNFTASAGVDFWTGDHISLVLGGRWYPVENVFIRARGLIGENDFSVGGGWSKPFGEHWKFEAMGDFYFKIDFAIRVGAVYVIRMKQ